MDGPYVREDMEVCIVSGSDCCCSLLFPNKSFVVTAEQVSHGHRMDLQQPMGRLRGSEDLF